MQRHMQRHIQKVFRSKTYALHGIKWLMQHIDTSHFSLLHFVFFHETVTYEKRGTPPRRGQETLKQ